MSTQFYDLLDATGNIVSATITLASLATSATAGRQSDAITIYSTVNSQSVKPSYLEVMFQAKLTSGTLANDKTAYLFMAQSVDETAYEAGPPDVGASDAAYTFSNSPVGTSPLPTDLRLVGAMTFNAQSESHRKRFIIVAPPPKAVFVVLNYTGIAFTGTAGDHFIKVRKCWGYGN